MSRDSKDLKRFRAKMRVALANYMWSEGCSCCENTDKHDEQKAVLGKMLNVPKYDDGSGYEFSRYRDRPHD